MSPLRLPSPIARVLSFLFPSCNATKALCVLLVSVLCFCLLGLPSHAQQSATVSVILTQPYTDTGLQVSSGQLISVTASGTMNWYTGSCNEQCLSTPNGEACSFQGFYFQGFACWSLVGQIVGGPPFQVGTSLQNFPATNTGELYLGVNDTYYGDNTGAWTASVTVTTPVAPSAMIFFNGNNITGTTQSVLAGQRIDLTTSLPQGASPVDGKHFWDAAGAPVGGFTVSPGYNNPQSGSPAATDFTKGETVFYWTSGGTFQVTVSYLLNGQTAMATAEFDVTGPPAPSVMTPLDTTHIEYLNNLTGPSGEVVQGYYLIFGNESSPYGITFEIESAPSSGSFVFLQLIEDIVQVYLGSGNQSQVCSSSAGLDTYDPYSFSLGSLTTADSPGQALTSPYVLEAEYFSARMYVLWNPMLSDGSDSCVLPSKNGPGTCTSISVPVGYVDWNWYAGAGLYQGSWSMLFQNEAAAPFQQSPEFPKWSKRVVGNRIPCQPL